MESFWCPTRVQESQIGIVVISDYFERFYHKALTWGLFLCVVFEWQASQCALFRPAGRPAWRVFSIARVLRAEN